MKKLCMVLYVFGEKYQEYIPLFLLSLFKLYPEYGVRIYLDRKLNPAIKKHVDGFKNYDCTIIEDYTDNLGMTEKAAKVGQIQKCQRWLFYDEAFNDYEAVYIGDIDIVFCPEKNPMFEEHMKHCEVIGKPYSNIKRTSPLLKGFNLKLIARNFIKFGVSQSVKYYLNPEKCVNKLTGLHFFKTKDYRKKVLPIMPEFVKELNLLAEGKSKRYNLCSFNNETMLHDLMLDSGFGVPEISDNGGNASYNVSEDGGQPHYRPHHGLHLGTFRDMQSAYRESVVTKSELYKRYYNYFKELEQTTEYKNMEKDFSPYMKDIISNMHEFYAEVKK